MLLTLSFDNDLEPGDDAGFWAVLQERHLRELRYRDTHREELETAMIVSLVESIPARDVGDICHVCREPVTWTDHLPGQNGVRCFKNVIQIGDAV